ncbi:hypothetical protein O6H91_Y088400 [Diphasiastrum complanatum]|nr:hypothetical protein O6H91_Y088400 [Diphasiastrum complanatum]
MLLYVVLILMLRAYLLKILPFIYFSEKLLLPPSWMIQFVIMRNSVVNSAELYCDMTVLPSLLPSRRDAAQAQNALNMLSQCFRYGLATSKCRVSILLQHFGEDFQDRQCKMCDVCLHGPPPWENLTKEAMSLLDLLNQQSVSLKGLLNEASPVSKCVQSVSHSDNSNIILVLAK